MKKIVISGAVAALLSAPAMAQNVGNASIDELRQTVERLEGEVEYLKETAMADRKDTAQKAVTLETLATTASKYTWSGDFRYRHEDIRQEGNPTTRERDRLRLRFGVLVKVNDTINGKLQISSTNTGDDNARSTNQTLGENWNRKTLSIDQAYVDWKPSLSTTVTVGKMTQPWTRTVSYYWDGDLSPEGAAIKYVSGVWFGNASYMWLSEQNNSSSNATSSIFRSTDSKMVSAQVGIRQPIGTSVLTAAVGYFDLHHVQNQAVSLAAGATGCTLDADFNQAFANSTNGNSTYVSSGCNLLLSDFNLLEAQVQYDFIVGKFPMSVFVDYMQNGGAEVNPTAGKKLDTALAYGVTFNRASLPKSWEVGVVYQDVEKDSVWGQFHDSDNGGGTTDWSGPVLKAAYVPALNWTLNAAYIMSERNMDVPATNGTITTARKDHDYKRLQLDLNYRF